MAFVRQGMAAGSHRSPDGLFRSDSPTSDPDSPLFPDLAGFSMDLLDLPLEDIGPRTITPPLRPFADGMIRWYRRHFHSIFPFLSWPAFEGRYRTLWKEPEQPHPGFEELLFHATLNMVLALACLRNDAMSLQDRYFAADEFYKRSVRLVSAESLDAASIPIVQMLLLRAYYLYFAGKADRCWLMSGAAIRVAIGMGLNAPPKKEVSQLERELRRKVWQAGCVSLDQ